MMSPSISRLAVPVLLVALWAGEGAATHAETMSNPTRAFGVGPAEILAPRSLTPMSAFTLEAWVWPSDVRSAQKIISNSEMGGFNLGLSEKQHRSGWFQFAVYLEPGKAYREVFGGPAYGDRWQHVAGTYDGHHLRVFVDGKLQAMELCEAGALQPSPAALLVGGEASANGDHQAQIWRGLIGGIRLSSSVRYVSDFSLPAVPRDADKETVLLVVPTGRGWGFDLLLSPDLEWARGTALKTTLIERPQ